jgi:hypothetical protein
MTTRSATSATAPAASPHPSPASSAPTSAKRTARTHRRPNPRRARPRPRETRRVRDLPRPPPAGAADAAGDRPVRPLPRRVGLGARRADTAVAPRRRHGAAGLRDAAIESVLPDPSGSCRRRSAPRSTTGASLVRAKGKSADKFAQRARDDEIRKLYARRLPRRSRPPLRPRQVPHQPDHESRVTSLASRAGSATSAAAIAGSVTSTMRVGFSGGAWRRR